MTKGVFTLAKWVVKPGQEAAFISAWQALGAEFRRLPSPPIGDGSLLQSLTDPALHYSFGPWESAEAIAAMREDANALKAIQEVFDCCDEAQPGGFRLIATS